MTRRRLPIGIQTFRTVRQEGCYYVDKTDYIRRLLDEGAHYFLSRPRRFGKSLSLDTCKELLEGNEALFHGLSIHERWDWSVCHPVVRLSFGSGHFQGPGDLRTEVMDRLEVVESDAERDLDTVFAPELPGLDRDTVREWYNGHGWLGEEKVYNPFDILLLFDSRKFSAWWFETGTPAFLVETLFKRRVTSLALGDMVGSAELLSTFDVDDMPTEALLFQTGYLTIVRSEPRGGEMFYRLGYPNLEVRQSLNRSLLNHMTGDPSSRSSHSARLYDLLLVNDFEGLKALFHSFYASIPHQWYTSNDIARFEGYYASVFYSYFAGLGLDVTVEDSTSHGRLDMAVRFNGNVYLFELKVVEMAPEGAAMAQLKKKRYADKYRGAGVPIHLVAVEFSKDARNVVAFDVESG